MTHHVGYTLQFEQAMQLVNPSVSIPYWEYTIEGDKRSYVAYAIVDCIRASPSSSKVLLTSEIRGQHS